jgi:hypothetical protein
MIENVSFRDPNRLLNAPDKADYLIRFLEYAIRHLIPSIPKLYEEYDGFCNLCNARFFEDEEECSEESHDAFNDLPEVTVASMFFGSIMTNLGSSCLDDDYPGLDLEWRNFFREVEKVFNPCMFCANHVSNNDPAMDVKGDTEHDFHYLCYTENQSVPSILENLTILEGENDAHIFAGPKDFIRDPGNVEMIYE